MFVGEHDLVSESELSVSGVCLRYFLHRSIKVTLRLSDSETVRHLLRLIIFHPISFRILLILT